MTFASALMVHSEINDLSFIRVEIEELSAISLAFQQRETSIRLQLEGCDMTPNLTKNLRCLLTADTLESLILVDGQNCAEDQPLDLSGALRCNQSLKKLFKQKTDGYEQTMAFSPETIQNIHILLRTNEDIQMLFLSFIDVS